MKTAEKKKKGVLAGFASRLQRNRLGDLLVGNGQITPAQLRAALQVQKETGFALGTVLKEQGLLTNGTLRAVLTQQMAWRTLAACMAFVVGFSALGIQTARATSASAERTTISKRSLPEGGTLQQASINRNIAVAPRATYEPLFGLGETRSADISPFTKWTGIMARLNSKSAPMPAELAGLAGKSQAEVIEGVNSFYNKVRYIEDKNNWGASDYWATPAEFTSRGGDCEDYVIAKYAALKKLGFTEDQLRLVVLQDTWKGIPHAILVVYSDDGAKFLDNQYKEVKDVAGFDRYRPVYSINRTGWWRHT